MNTLVSISLIIVGIIHVLPVIGLLGNQQLSMLYGVTLTDHNLSLLMRHRAVLFGLIGGSLIIVAVKTSLHWPALFIALVSTASFVIMAFGYHGLTDELEKVAKVDLVCVVILIVAIVVKALVN